jgi:hypothetical protein
MNELHRSLSSLFRELALGPPAAHAFILNPGDQGLLASLERLPASAASVSSSGGATIAAHVAHLAYGLSLVNRWAAGENPWNDADWANAWTTTDVSEAAWADLRRELRDQADRWLTALRQPRAMAGVELDAVIGTVAHFAYHLGAIRQIDRGTRGPKESTGS